MGRRRRALAAWIGSAVLTLLLLLSTDAVLDATLRLEPRLMPAGTTVRYRSFDFDVTASINAYGIRGPERELAQGQIAVVGDSFTFGLGSSDEAIWPRLLERDLAARSDRRSVYNLGMPGTHTLHHLRIARDFVSEYKPSVLVLCVLLGDDLQQVAEAAMRKETVYGTAADAMRQRLVHHFGGLYKLYAWARKMPRAPAAGGATATVTDAWRGQLTALIERRSAAFPDALRHAARSGQINPALFQQAEHYPDRSWRFWQSLRRSEPAALATAQVVQTRLRQLAASMDLYGGKLLVLSMPSGEFVDSEFTRNYRLYGADIPASNLTSSEPEELLGDLVRRGGAAFVPVLAAFRAVDSDLFFPTDGHLNQRGNRLVADVLLRHLPSAPAR